MAETRIDKLKDEKIALKACIRLMLTTPGDLKGRALAEHLVGVSYQPPIEQVCGICGAKYVGSSCQNSGCRPERYP